MLKVIPHEKVFIKLLEFFIELLDRTEDTSPCTRAALVAAILCLVATGFFGGNSNLFDTILLLTFVLLLLSAVTLQAINGFRPTFCMNDSERNLNRQLVQRKK